MGTADTPPAPKLDDPGEDIQKYASGISAALPGLIGAESSGRPQFGTLNLQDIAGRLSGVGGQQGLYQIGQQATQQGQQQLDSSRAADFANQQGNTGAVRGILQGLNTEGANQVANQNNLANQAYQQAQGVSPEQARTSDQQARAAFASRGRLNDNAAVSSEILGRQDVLAANRNNAMTLSNQAATTANQFYTPGQSLLNGAPAATLLGQDYLNRGQAAVGSNTPQLINTGAATNSGAANANTLNNYNSNVSSINNANKSANTQAGVSALSAVASIAAAFSDRKVKKNVKRVGKTDRGTPIYTYQYKGDPKTQMGVMAQDQERVAPRSVHVIGGTRAVDYSKIK